MIEQAVSLTEIADALREVNPRHAGEFVAAQKIADLAHESMQDVWSEDWRENQPNPFYGQTEQGLIVVRGRGDQVFDTLMTPWGEWHTMGSRLGVVFDSAQFLESVTLEQRQRPPAPSVSFTARLGEYYEVKSVGGLTLPSAFLRKEMHNDEQTRRAWTDLQTRYDSLVPPRRTPHRTRR